MDILVVVSVYSLQSCVETECFASESLYKERNRITIHGTTDSQTSSNCKLQLPRCLFFITRCFFIILETSCLIITCSPCSRFDVVTGNWTSNYAITEVIRLMDKQTNRQTNNRSDVHVVPLVKL